VREALARNSTDVQTWLLKGELELSLEDPAAAEASFGKVLEFSPELPAARIGLTRALLAQQKADAAGEQLRALERLNIHDPLINYLQAVEARQKNDLKTAQDALREVLRKVPGHAPSQLLMGQIHLLRRELDQAKSMLSSYVAQVPGNVTGRKLLAAVLVELDEPQEAIKLLVPVEQANPDDAQVLSLLGTAYMKLNDITRGREYLDRASKSAPDAAAIRTQLAVSHLASGDTALAATELEAVIERSPEFSRADFLLILTRLREGNTDAALAAAKHLLEKHPERAEAHNLLGAVHETRQETELARAAYEKSLELSADSTAAALNLARLDLIASDTDGAAKRFRDVLGKHPNEATALMGLAKLASDAGDSEEALTLLEQARRENPSAVRPRLVLANYYLRRGRADNALAIMLEAHRHAANTPAVMLLLGRAQLASGKAADARATLERLTATAPGAPLAHLNLAMAQQAANDPAAARGSLQRTLELQPDNHFARAALGQIEVRTGRYDEALAIAERLATDLPAAPAAEVLRGDVRQAQGDLPAAVAAYRAGFERQPSSPLLLKLVLAEQRAGMAEQARTRALAWLKEHPDDASVRSILAASAHQGGNKDDAVTQYERVLETAPHNIIALNNLAWLYDQRGDARGLDLAKRAHELRPDRPEVQDTYGWLLVKAGRVEQGLALIEKAVEGAPGNKDILFHRAAALHRAGESNRARKLLEELLTGSTQFSERDAAQALLEQLRKS
jgi:putative PEP-CTERM system TPR-repeat lipoprotein